MKEMLASKNELLLVFCFVMIISGCTAPSLSIEPHHLEMLVSLDGEEDEYYEDDGSLDLFLFKLIPVEGPDDLAVPQHRQGIALIHDLLHVILS